MMRDMDATETGLVVPIPSLQEFVSEWRPKVDRVEPVGVPAHVTVLYPFIPPNRVPENLDEMRKFFLSGHRLLNRLVA
jgi:hypothetical protein